MKKRLWLLNVAAKNITSVSKISQNLSETYRECFADTYEIEEFFLSAVEENSFRAKLLEMKKSPPEIIAVIHPEVVELLPFLALLSLNQASHFLIHLFGNFIRKGDGWYNLQNHIAEKKVSFIAPSATYQKVLQHFIADPVHVVPFPMLLKKESSFPKTKSDSLRLLYTGRFHAQKNIPLLIKALDEIAGKKQQSISLTLAGHFDDSTPATLYQDSLAGDQFRYIQKAMAQISPFLKIDFVPFAEKIHDLYFAHDAFITLSTYFDDDYGYSLLEALSCGIPCLSTYWGGLKDICDHFPESCFSLEVSEENNSLVIDLDSLEGYLEKIKPVKPELESFLGKDIFKKNLENIIQENVSASGFQKELQRFSHMLHKQGLVGEELKQVYRVFWSSK